jgi:hypothetical protein
MPTRRPARRIFEVALAAEAKLMIPAAGWLGVN